MKREESLYRVTIIPFLNTPPLSDVGLLLYLLPVWWILGIEQFIWLPGFGLAALKVIARRKKVKFVSTLRWMYLFLITNLVSGLFIEEGFRIISFLRAFGCYVAIFFLVFILTNEIHSWDQIDLLLRRLIFTILLASLVGILGIVGLWRPVIPSIAGFFFPDWSRNSDYGIIITFRDIGYIGWFLGVDYFRVSSFFLYPTLYASVLAATLPMIFFYTAWSEEFKTRIFWGLAIIVVFVNLLWTTGRIAIISFLIGACYYAIAFSRVKYFFRYGLVTLLFFLALTIMITEEVRGYLIWLYETLILARGSGSYYSRLLVYIETVRLFVDRPLFGWGTELDLPNVGYPAGSHSYYLGVLFRYGLIGLLTFTGLFWSVWKKTRPLNQKNSEKLGKFLEYGRWIMVLVLVNSLTDSLDIDATTLVIIWLYFSLLISARGIAETRNKITTLLERS